MTKPDTNQNRAKNAENLKTMSKETTETDVSNDNNDNSGMSTSRRAVLTGALAVASSGAAGYLTGTAAAQTSEPAGYVGTSAEPYLRAYVDRMVFVPRTSDPSSPTDGTLWYNSEA